MKTTWGPATPRGITAEAGGTPGRLDGDRGAVIIEMALIAPFLFMVIFAIVEFGYGYGQSLDVRHGARESARLAAVNYRATAVTGNAQTTEIVAATCARMQIVGGDDTSVSLGFVESGAAGKQRGDFAFVEVKRPLKQMTGFLDFALHDVALSSRVETRLEQDRDVERYVQPGGMPMSTGNNPTAERDNRCGRYGIADAGARLTGEHGLALPFVALMMVVLLAFVAFAVDHRGGLFSSSAVAVRSRFGGTRRCRADAPGWHPRGRRELCQAIV